MKNSEYKTFNGIAILAAMFREVSDPIFRKKLYRKLETQSPILAALVDETEFLFSDIDRLDSPSIKKVLSIFPPSEWTSALKHSDRKTQEFLLNQMPEGRRNNILEELAYKKVKISPTDSIKAQLKIAKTISDQLKLGALKINSKRLIKNKA